VASEPPEPTRGQKAFFWFAVVFIAAAVLFAAFYLYVDGTSG
jgi:hypothetical protein